MKLWILRVNEDRSVEYPDPWHPSYDKFHGFLIRAESEERARILADRNGGDENNKGQHPWLNSEFSTCEELSVDGVEEILISDYLAG
jgi:hypothetical protein